MRALNVQVEEVGRAEVDEMLKLFPATLAPYSIEEIVAAEPPRDF